MELVLYFRKGKKPRLITSDNKKPGQCVLSIAGIQEPGKYEEPDLIEEGLTILQEALKTHSLTHFSMEYLTLYWETEKDLFQLLSEQKKITSVRITDCVFGNENEAIAGFLIQNLLEGRNIRECKIENSFYTGALSNLAKCVRNNQSLEEFYIKEDGVDQSVLIELIKACGQHSSLERVTILGNSFLTNYSEKNKETINELVTLLVSNKSIKFLKVNNTEPRYLTHFDTEWVTAIQQALKVNITLNSYKLFSMSAKHGREYGWAIHGGFDGTPRKKLEEIIAQEESPANKLASTLLFFNNLGYKIVNMDSDLSEINFENISLNDHRISVLCSAVAFNSTITSLNLSKNFISRKAARNLSDLLLNNGHLKSINLSHNHLSNNEVNYFARKLHSNTALKSLNLSYNNICNEGAQFLGKMLQVNTALTSINLENNSISFGFESLSKALRANSTLECLNLNNNLLREQEAKHMGVLVRINSTLKTLDCSHNYIGTGGASYLSKGLRYNQGLISIDLTGNGIQKTGILDFAKNLSSNTTLTSLNLEKNGTLDKESLRFTSKLTFFKLSVQEQENDFYLDNAMDFGTY